MPGSGARAPNPGVPEGIHGPALSARAWCPSKPATRGHPLRFLPLPRKPARRADPVKDAGRLHHRWVRATDAAGGAQRSFADGLDTWFVAGLPSGVGGATAKNRRLGAPPSRPDRDGAAYGLSQTPASGQERKASKTDVRCGATIQMRTGVGPTCASGRQCRVLLVAGTIGKPARAQSQAHRLLLVMPSGSGMAAAVSALLAWIWQSGNWSGASEMKRTGVGRSNAGTPAQRVRCSGASGSCRAGVAVQAWGLFGGPAAERWWPGETLELQHFVAGYGPLCGARPNFEPFGRRSGTTGPKRGLVGLSNARRLPRAPDSKNGPSRPPSVSETKEQGRLMRAGLFRSLRRRHGRLAT